jgi:ABC-2 type transport system permease protein
VLATAAALFGAEPPAEPLRALGAGVVCALCAAALGAAIGALSPTTRTATAVASAVYFPTIFLSGIVMAPEALPAAARAAGEGLPLTQAVRGLSDAWTGAPLAPETLLVPAAVVVLGAAACARAFRWS